MTTETSGELESTHSIFEQSWWLDAVAPGQWRAAIVEKDGRTVARLPYAERSRFGLRLLGNPPLSPYLGPWLSTPSPKYVTRLSEEMTLLEELIEQLPPCDLFHLTLAPTATNLLPFHWKGWTRKVSVSYRLEQLHDLTAVWDGFDQKCRTAIRKAQKTVKVRTDLDLETFFNCADKTFQRQNTKTQISRQLVTRIDAACRARDAQRIFFAEDAEGRIHAVLYLVFDSRAAYYLIGGADPELRASGAQNLLVWEAIQFASTVSKVFDFEGSSVPGIEQAFRAYGATQTLIPQVYKMSRRLSALTGAKTIVEAITGRRVKWFV